MEKAYNPENEYSTKDLSFLQEIGNKFGYNSREYKEFLGAIEKDKAAKKLGLSMEKQKNLIEMVKEIIKIIDSVSLIKINKKENQILEKQKNTAKLEIKKLLKCANNYVASLNAVERAGGKKNSLGPDDYRKIYEESDAQRRRAHNALFDQAAITSRFIINHFGELTDAQADKFEEQQEKTGQPVLDLHRKRFPKNLLWPNKVNINNRESLGEWALLISQELKDIALDNL